MPTFQLLRTLMTTVTNDKYLDEMQELLLELTGTNVSTATLSRTMAALDITHKSASFQF